jgi:hypothetical protein
MADLRRVYIDSCCFIDMVKVEVGQTLATDIERDVWFLKKLLEAHRDKEVRVFTSTLTIAECTHVGDLALSEKVKSEFTRLLISGQYVHLVQMTPFIAIDARDLRWNRGISLRGPDGVHVASALEMKCEEFLSGDGKLQRVEAQGARLISLGLTPRRGSATVCLPDKYRQLELSGRTP